MKLAARDGRTEKQAMVEIHKIGPARQPAFPEALLRLRSVVAMVGISSTEIYRRMEAGTFPRPVQVGEQRVAWRQSELQEWIASLPTQAAPKEKRPAPGKKRDRS